MNDVIIALIAAASSSGVTGIILAILNRKWAKSDRKREGAAKDDKKRESAKLFFISGSEW